jgi:hypothetical protein
MSSSVPRRRVLSLVLCCSVAVALSPSMARADDCIGTSLEKVVDPKAAHAVAVEFDKKLKRWRAVWTLGNAKHQALLDGPGDHAHLTLLVLRGTPRFAIVDASAGHELDGRIRIYEPDGKLARAVGLGQIMTKTEIAAISRSKSHLEWLAAAPRLAANGDAIELPVVGGRVASLSIAAHSTP